MPSSTRPVETLDPEQGAPRPDLTLGAELLDVLQDDRRIRRRVETISFLSDHTLRRYVTFDLYPPPQTFTDSWFPVTFLRKDLLTDFDLRDNSGNALSVATRDEQSYRAWSLVCAQIDRCGHTTSAPAILQHLRDIVSEFPNSDEPISIEQPHSWQLDSISKKAAEAQWRRIENCATCSGLLRDLTFNFMLLTTASSAEGPYIVKLGYNEGIDPGRFRMGGRIVEVDAPAAGWSTSFHMQFRAPEGFQILDAALVRHTDAPPPEIETEDGEKRAPSQGFGPSETEHDLGAEEIAIKRSQNEIHLYAKKAKRIPYSAILYMTVRIPGLLRATWLAALFNTAVLATMALTMGRVAGDHVSIDALAALLLIIPSTLTAYLVQPGEHDLLARALFRPRVFMTATAAIIYVVAGTIALGFDPQIVQAVAVTGFLVSIVATTTLTMTMYGIRRFSGWRKADLDRTRRHPVLDSHQIR